MSSHSPALLEIQNLRVAFAFNGELLPAVDGVSMAIPRGKTVALVGESGCGKSVTALSILRLVPQPPGRLLGGRVLWRRTPGVEPVDLLTLPDRELPAIRGGQVAMIFQDPLASLNPVYSVGAQVAEAIELHQGLSARQSRKRAVEMLDRVGIAAPKQRAREYPHQLSGGMRQRVMIAMALACEPSLLIADEPTTALDVTVQSQILDLLEAITDETGMSVLLITHDLGVVARTADDVYVMYAGRIVEHAPVKELLTSPLHPYTQGLLRCMPTLGGEAKRLPAIRGEVPSRAQPPRGCPFHPRCDLTVQHARESNRAVIQPDTPTATAEAVLRRCVEPFDAEPSGVPVLKEIATNHFVACWETA